MANSELIKPGIILCLFSLLISSTLLCNFSNAESIKRSDAQQNPLIEKIKLAMDANYRMDSERSEVIFNEAISEWPEDYYYLATAYAGLKKEKEAFKYLRKAIIKDWKMVDFEEQPEWQPYRHSITNRAVNQIRMKEETR